MKQTATDWMFDQLWETPKDKLAWFKILMDAKEMEKEQILDVWIDAYTTNMKAVTRCNFTMWANNYYNENYGDK
jgi:hypothetical protein